MVFFVLLSSAGLTTGRHAVPRRRHEPRGPDGPLPRGGGVCGHNCEAGADRYAGPRGEARALIHPDPSWRGPKGLRDMTVHRNSSRYQALVLEVIKVL